MNLPRILAVIFLRCLLYAVTALAWLGFFRCAVLYLGGSP